MSGLSSYPRTSGSEENDYVPAAAYANVPEPLRSQLIKHMARHRQRFNKQYPAMDFLVPAYLEPGKFKPGSRADEEGRLFPEPGACFGDMPRMSGRFPSSIDESDPVFAKFQDKLSTFSGVVEQASNLSDDENVWRFIGANYNPKKRKISDRYYSNPLGGNFWGIGSVPTTEAEWRNSCAIPGIWNGDGGYIICRVGDLPKEIRDVFKAGVIGTVAPQPSMVHGHYFEGGARQLLVDSFQLRQFDYFFNNLPIQRSNWNR